jgi:hypothetical protein
MLDNDLIDRVVEFCLTHTERYSTTQEPDAVKLTDDANYWLTVRPDRVKPGELLPGSAKHRQARIKAWQTFARAALSE